MSKLSANNGKKQFPDGDFTKVNNAIIESYLSKLTPRQLRVYLVLAYRANNTTQIAQWTQEKIAKMAGCTERHVRRALDSLVHLHLIERADGNYRLLPVLKTGHSEPAKPDIQDATTGHSEPGNRTFRSPEPDIQSQPFNVFNPDSGTDSVKNQTGLNDHDPPSPLIVNSLEDKADHLRSAIGECWKVAHGGQTPWTPRAHQLVNQLVAEIPYTGAQWRQCIANRFASDGVNLGHIPEKFLAEPRSSKWSIDSFLAGPLNRFGEPRDGINGYDPNLPAHSNRNRHTMEKLKLMYDKDGFDDDLGGLLLGPDKPVRRFN